MSLEQPSNLILANWKMNLSVSQSIGLTKALVSGLNKIPQPLNFSVALCPSFPVLAAVGALVKNKVNFSLGAQDVFWQGSGPYTGEVSPAMLAELGVKYVIVGHSERRQYLKETSDMIRHKVIAVLEQGLIPVLCVGETYAQRQAGQRDSVLSEQLNCALSGVNITGKNKIIIAYEPVWAIGTGQAVTQPEVNQAVRVIEDVLFELWSSDTVRRQLRIIYGGSVDKNNISNYINGDLLAGALVGGASLQAADFLKLLRHLATL
ncbi:MAG: triose-phosphate isomerase [Patescibacteria group bacterium]